MPYLFLTSAVVLISLAMILAALYNQRSDSGLNAVPLYNLLWVASSFLVFVILYITDCSFDARVLPYSIGFGVCFAAACIGEVGAIKHGPVSLTALLMQMTLIVATVYGFFFWDAPISRLVLPGLVLVVVSLFLCIYTHDPQGKGVSRKWLLYATVAFFGNAGCTVLQKQQQYDFEGQHGNMLMFFGMLIALIICFAYWFFFGRRGTVAILRKAGMIPIIAGVGNAFQNLLVILLASTTLSAGIVYPVLAVGSLMLTILLSVLLFKERLSPRKWIGIAVGTLAILLFKL